MPLVNLNYDILLAIINLLRQDDAFSFSLTCRYLFPIARDRIHSSIRITQSPAQLIKMCEYMLSHRDQAQRICSLEIYSQAIIGQHVTVEPRTPGAAGNEPPPPPPPTLADAEGAAYLERLLRCTSSLSRLTLACTDLLFSQRPTIGAAIAGLENLSMLSLLNIGPQTPGVLNGLNLCIKTLHLAGTPSDHLALAMDPQSWCFVRELKPLLHVQNLRLSDFWFIGLTVAPSDLIQPWLSVRCLELNSNHVSCSDYPRLFPMVRCVHLDREHNDYYGDHHCDRGWKNMGCITASTLELSRWQVAQNTQVLELSSFPQQGVLDERTLKAIRNASPVVLRLAVNHADVLDPKSRYGMAFWKGVAEENPGMMSMELFLTGECSTEPWTGISRCCHMNTNGYPSWLICLHSRIFKSFFHPEDSQKEISRRAACSTLSLHYFSIAEMHPDSEEVFDEFFQPAWAIPQTRIPSPSSHNSTSHSYGTVFWWKISGRGSQRATQSVSSEEGERVRKALRDGCGV
ncbi:hypothetical protein POSPLADRAFT_1045978 [Postia placenta MAD-698-R-SB12]|uniref:F-box domain-containing protein n=1 Tax=Postia placenta MAD-698-R-SB12 TaxID=670580 RepID=A0A1X6N5T9_9APHY|nr:hypothetical protein POSPLADRAFT_1045978 [Postia placenta MAD-698-R-SB12]OSX63773.1 hypothetical protein POSPLADRAFT_1045978 [Postia placenta MAD-698-R-SB12]